MDEKDQTVPSVAMGAAGTDEPSLKEMVSDVGLLEFSAYKFYQAEQRKHAAVELRWSSLDWKVRKRFIGLAGQAYVDFVADEIRGRIARAQRGNKT